LGQVLEVEGIIGHIVNKGGQPAVSLTDPGNRLGLSVFFGPKEKKPITKLKQGEIAVFKGILTRAPVYLHPGELSPAIVPR